MADKKSPLIRSAQIINTLWIPACVLYFIEHVGISKSLGAPFGWFRFIDPAISLAVQIIFISWLWGFIIETTTGESTITRLENLKLNLKKCWWVVAITLAAPQAIHFLTFIINGKEMIPLPLLKSSLYAFTAYWAAGEFFKIKYKSRTTRPINDIFWSWDLLFYISFSFTLSMLLQFIITKTAALSLIQPLAEIILIQIQFLTFVLFAWLFSNKYPEISASFQSSKTLILVNPPAGSVRAEAFAPLTIRYYPVFFAILRAFTPPSYRVIEYNRVTWREHFYQGNALVAISCFTASSAAAYHIAQEFRRRGSKVIIGGPHVTFFAEEALTFCDSVVVGAAESVWAQIVEDYENNDLKRIYHGHCSEQESTRVQEYLMTTPVEIAKDCLQITRGCKFNCHFCCATALTDSYRYKRSVSEIMPLIKKIADQKKPVTFLDNNIYEDPVYAKELFRAMIPLKNMWGASASIDIAKDDEAIQLLKESKCVQFSIGFEIDAASAMQKKGGKFALAQDYLKLTRKLKKAGIMTQTQFIFGFPGDSWGSLPRLWWFCFRLSPTYTLISFLSPLPGSRYFEECVREGRIINLNWRCYDIMRQVAETPQLKRSWILQNAFTLMFFFFFLTTSTMGRALLVLVVIMEYVFYHGPK